MKVEKPPMDKSGNLYTVCAVLSYCGLQSRNVHLYTDSGSRDIWVIHGWQSLPQTDEGSLFECGS